MSTSNNDFADASNNDFLAMIFNSYNDFTVLTEMTYVARNPPKCMTPKTVGKISLLENHLLAMILVPINGISLLSMFFSRCDVSTHTPDHT